MFLILYDVIFIMGKFVVKGKKKKVLTTLWSVVKFNKEKRNGSYTV